MELNEELIEAGTEAVLDAWYFPRTTPREHAEAVLNATVPLIRLEGWVPLGTHVDVILPDDRKLELSEVDDESGLPLWERIVSVDDA